MVAGCFCFFFFNDTATTEIYTLSLHDALPICDHHVRRRRRQMVRVLSRAAPDRRRHRASHLGLYRGRWSGERLLDLGRAAARERPVLVALLAEPGGEDRKSVV